MRLVIVHYHLRPGGIRRIIELAVPHLVREAPRTITRVVLATGQTADSQWHRDFAKRLTGTPVEVVVEPSFNYLSEQGSTPQDTARMIRAALDKLFHSADHRNCLVWAHNLGVGRNLLLARELAAACGTHGIPLVTHHHDWWFDNRWTRWTEMRTAGFRTLAAPAQAVFPEQKNVLHATINRADAEILDRHLNTDSVWLPNVAALAPPPTAARVRNARRWLKHKISHAGSPVWLLPCRTLRRKNIAEALLLMRWLRPEAWLVTTGAASSAEEQPYFQTLERAARRHSWRLRLGVLAGNEAGQPSVDELLAVSETVLLTSVQEGFGLPYIEAAAAQRPLVARRLPNIAPDLDQFGFRFPQSYEEILVAPTLFKWRAERARQQRLFRDWSATIPAAACKLVATPFMLARPRPRPLPFSRLTLTAQLEVLAHPAAESWAACAPLNPLLEVWRLRAATGELQVTPWPHSAKSWLGGQAYARKFFTALAAQRKSPGVKHAPLQIQADLIKSKLAAHNLHPLLWNTRT